MTDDKLFVAPVAYQGGKSRVAKAIVEHLLETRSARFYDLCCGSGAIAIELVRSGVATTNITMCDIGPWGRVWSDVGQGKFSIPVFAEHIQRMPKSVGAIQGYVQELSRATPSESDFPYIYLLLQACSFGGKAIWYSNSHWQNTSFRSYWTPTETSSRRSPVNPMMPMPDTLLERMRVIVERMYGVHGICGPAESILAKSDDCIYIDPPYSNTTHYGYDTDLNVVIQNSRQQRSRLFISEGTALPGCTRSILVSQGRTKGGISGERKREPNEEWLADFDSSPYI